MFRLFHFKVLIVFILAFLGIGLMVMQQRMLKETLLRMNLYMNRFHRLQSEALRLKHTVLKANYYLYYDNDKIINNIETFKKDLRHLLNDPHIKNEHPKTASELNTLATQFTKTQKLVYDFMTLNASMKNSTIYLPSLTLRALERFKMDRPLDHKIIRLLARIDAEIFLAKSALDLSFIKTIKHYNDQLVNLIAKVKDPVKIHLLRTMLRHLNLFMDYFPRFEKDLNKIMQAPLSKTLERAIDVYNQESTQELKNVTRIGYLFIILYLLMIVAVLYFVYFLEKESRIDRLTGLGNRKDFQIQMQHFDRPILILVDIDRFKHINEYYGTQVADALLIETAKLLRAKIPRPLKAKLFRLGGDEFGVLYNMQRGIRLEGIIENILGAFEETHFVINDLPPIEITVTIGASMEKERLLESADMALKAAKGSKRERFVIYSSAIDVTQKIAANIRASKQLKKALMENRIVPFFQPIVDLRTSETIKYEALARLKISESEVLTPYHFLEAATQTKMSGELTRRVLLKTLDIAEKTGKFFSVNISVGDMTDRKDREAIYRLLSRYGKIAPQITFEILESEEIEDYEEISLFVEEMKKYGCQVAVDDFGSGYSNFEKLLQLDIDLIKIDGTLIRNIDHDRHAELVVRTIVDFAKEAKLQTVAEFVHCNAVAEKIKEMGVEMGQGFYLGRPMPAEDIFATL